MADFTKDRLDAIMAGARLPGQTDIPNIPVAIETGTFEGKTTLLLADSGYFDVVHSIELSVPRWKRACVELRHPKIQLQYGDSAVWTFMYAKLYADRPILWYLDAHWFSTGNGSSGKWGLPVAHRREIPLWSELAAISARSQPDIVVVDDVHAFGRKDDKVWSNVTRETIDAALGSRRRRSQIGGDQYVAWLKAS